MRVDPKKIASMQEWPCTKTLIKSLHGFLGLTRYYIKFVRNYGKIVAPLTTILNKNQFSWNQVAEKSFSILKKPTSNTPLLVVPYFSKTSVLECDALGKGLDVILIQEGYPLEFTSKLLCDKNLGKCNYKK